MIWVDLDHTLIYVWEPLISTPFMSAIFGRPMDLEPPPLLLPRFKRIDVAGLGVGHACARRSARKFLEALRVLGETRMLTSATRQYAEAMNEIFELGFSEDQIVARENLADATKLKVDPKGVLIDDASLDPIGRNYSRGTKLRYLGISERRVVEVAHFRGEVDDPFDRQWPAHLKRVRVLLKGRRAT
ncbi:hypothetical protein DB347_17630 [Opitutaceae bacterium EW11]|nr:hypothetical protein DB347_17630 [Opitutaceae bacterium EW11]